MPMGGGVATAALLAESGVVVEQVVQAAIAWPQRVQVEREAAAVPVLMVEVEAAVAVTVGTTAIV